MIPLSHAARIVTGIFVFTAASSPYQTSNGSCFLLHNTAFHKTAKKDD
jgi:hypothetical protein